MHCCLNELRLFVHVDLAADVAGLGIDVDRAFDVIAVVHVRHIAVIHVGHVAVVHVGHVAIVHIAGIHVTGIHVRHVRRGRSGCRVGGCGIRVISIIA